MEVVWLPSGSVIVKVVPLPTWLSDVPEAPAETKRWVSRHRVSVLYIREGGRSESNPFPHNIPLNPTTTEMLRKTVTEEKTKKVKGVFTGFLPSKPLRCRLCPWLHAL